MYSTAIHTLYSKNNKLCTYYIRFYHVVCRKGSVVFCDLRCFGVFSFGPTAASNINQHFPRKSLRNPLNEMSSDSKSPLKKAVGKENGLERNRLDHRMRYSLSSTSSKAVSGDKRAASNSPKSKDQQLKKYSRQILVKKARTQSDQDAVSKQDVSSPDSCKHDTEPSDKIESATLHGTPPRGVTPYWKVTNNLFFMIEKQLFLYTTE